MKSLFHLGYNFLLRLYATEVLEQLKFFFGKACRLRSSDLVTLAILELAFLGTRTLLWYILILSNKKLCMSNPQKHFEQLAKSLYTFKNTYY